MRLIRSGVGVALAALAFELLLRVLGFGGELVDARNGAYPPDDLTIRNRSGEGWASSRWTHEGVRAVPGPAAEGPPIVVLGDSVTQALQVDDQEVYTARLQKLLGVAVENRGCAACSPADYVAAARAVRAHEPTWIVVQLSPADLYGDAFDGSKTHFTIAGAALEVVEVRRRAPPLAELRRASALLDAGVIRAGMFRRGARMPPLFRASEVPRGEIHFPRSQHVEDVLDALRAAYSERVTFFFVPEFVESHHTALPYVDDRAADAERRFLAWCARENASCVDLRDAFGDFSRHGRAPSGFANSRFGQGHLNADGHRAAAELLGRELRNVRARGLF